MASLLRGVFERGKKLLIGTWKGEVIAWDVGSWNKRFIIRAHNIRFSPTLGTTLAMSGNFRNNSIVLLPNSGGDFVTGATDWNANIKVWDSEGRLKMVLIEDSQGKDIQADTIMSMAASPDGRFLAVGTWTGEISIWNTTTWEKVRVLKSGARYQFGIEALVFSRDGKTLVVGASPLRGETFTGEIEIWNVKTWKRLNIFRAHKKSVSYLALSPDGKTLVSCSLLDDELAIWDFKTRKLRLRHKHPHGSYVSAVFSADGSLLAAGGPSVQLYDTKTWKVIASLPPFRNDSNDGVGIAFSPDARLLATADNFYGVVRIWNVRQLLRNAPARRRAGK